MNWNVSIILISQDISFLWGDFDQNAVACICGCVRKSLGAAVYIRFIKKDSRVALRLICAKSRIAPLKQQILPRLELCVAVVGANLANRVKTDLRSYSPG